MDKVVRWKQRFSNLDLAYRQLIEAQERWLKDTDDTIIRSGLIQTFEFTFELSWKTLKDYIESKGTVVIAPRDVLKTAFQEKIIEDGHIWIEMLDARNSVSHLYNDNEAQKVAMDIVKNYMLPFKELRNYFNSKTKE